MALATGPIGYPLPRQNRRLAPYRSLIRIIGTRVRRKLSYHKDFITQVSAFFTASSTSLP